MTTPQPLTRLLLLQQPPFQRSLLCIRTFSNSSSHGAGVRSSNSFQPKQPQMKQPAQKSFAVIKQEQKEMIDKMPNDVGLIPGTFIMPTSGKLPSLFEAPSARWRVEKHRAWTRIKDTFA